MDAKHYGVIGGYRCGMLTGVSKIHVISSKKKLYKNYNKLWN